MTATGALGPGVRFLTPDRLRSDRYFRVPLGSRLLRDA